MKLKICGMRDEINIRAVTELQPDYMGFIFYEKSRRFVGNDFQLTPDFPESVKKVGVFVNETTATIVETSARHRLDLVQLHGTEGVEQCSELRNEGLGVIKVFSVDDSFDWKATTSFEGSVDYILFDTKGPGYGGTGIAFDWTGLKRYNQRIPFFLSGGVSPGNVGNVRALKGMNIHSLDANSGVERSPGRKDVELIKQLRVREIDF